MLKLIEHTISFMVSKKESVTEIGHWLFPVDVTNRISEASFHCSRQLKSIPSHGLLAIPTGRWEHNILIGTAQKTTCCNLKMDNPVGRF